MQEQKHEKYFAASNSDHGFVNYFPNIFNRKSCNRIYVIKGGPGTGKSRFMSDVAKEAEKRGMKVIYYYCSSDANSLDGIIIKNIGVGMLDGTFPHVFEPELSGAFEQIINLGDFWDATKLGLERERIEELSHQKSEAYKRAYRLLAAYGEINKCVESMVAPLADRKKLASAIKRLLHKLPSDKIGKTEAALCRAVGMGGKTYFGSYENNADMCFCLQGIMPHIMLEEISVQAKALGMSAKISYDPVLSHRIDAIELIESRTAFVCREKGEHNINTERFFDSTALKEKRDTIKKLATESKNIDTLVLDAFDDVKKYHFMLEDIYTNTMDFGKKEAFTRDFIQKLFPIAYNT